MNLTATKQLLQQKFDHRDFDSYAVYVWKDGDDCLLTSDNTDGDTYFDNASMGKVLVTATLILGAVSEGLLRLDSTLDEFFRDVPAEKKKITVQDLLTHTSGIVRIPIPDRVADCGHDAVARHIIDNPLAYETGKDMIYSCNGYILLGFILEKVYGKPLDVLYAERTVRKLGLTRSRFNIAIDEPNAAVCYRWRVPGKYRVDDENVYTLRGVAGNGASFSTLNDMKKFIFAVLDRDERLYPKEMYNLAEKNYTPDFSDGRGLGWLIVNERYPQTGKLFPVGSFGHCGHCGHSFFISREENMFVVILTNATRFANLKNDFKGYDYGVVCRIREEIHNAIAEDLGISLRPDYR